MDLTEYFSVGIEKLYEDETVECWGEVGKVKAEFKDPIKKGYWGKEFHSMTSQAAALGIPTFQLEINHPTREHLATNEHMLKKWAQLIVDVY